jgi:hypothetical protein
VCFYLQMKRSVLQVCRGIDTPVEHFIYSTP